MTSMYHARSRVVPSLQPDQATPIPFNCIRKEGSYAGSAPVMDALINTPAPAPFGGKSSRQILLVALPIAAVLLVPFP